MHEELYNIAQSLADMAAQAPFRPAIIFPAGRDDKGRAKFVQLSFQQLNALCDRYAHGLSRFGITRGERVLMMVRPGVELIAVTFALLKMGAVPILIDPGMGRKAFLQCVAETEPAAMIGIPLAHLLRILFPGPFKTVRKLITAGRRWFWGGVTLDEVCASDPVPFATAPTSPADEAAVAFTSGGTGIPKGVVYRHGIFKAQVEIMRQEMDIQPGEIHLAAMYIFALFNPALGVTTVIPDMDPRKTAQVNPAYLVEAIQTHGVTLSMGAPLIWEKVAAYCLAQRLKLPSLKHVYMFGAEVPPHIVHDFNLCLTGGKIYTPYGATEALPLTLIEAAEIIDETGARTLAGGGVCVGKAVGGVQIQVIGLTDDRVENWPDAKILPPLQVGEIVVKGNVVTREYLNRPQQTALAKIHDGTEFWHRMGDLGYFDDAGRLWICGRKAHRVETAHGLLLPIPCETIFNRHPTVKRTALVGIGPFGQQKPVIVVELNPEQRRLSTAVKGQIVAELKAMGGRHDHTRMIEIFLFHPAFPVDVRHNTKIQRQELAVWAAKHLISDC